uniref:Ig-like domain-containing protein n=1 Tax=Poecilia reticulata TaxID=8081 RepID=A0A3P9PGD4_POERE
MATFRGLSALILLGTMSVIQTLKVPDKIPLIEAELGQTVNLTCNTSGSDNGLFFWYKMTYGHMAQTVVSGTFSDLKPDKNFPKSRFQIGNVGDIKWLIIRNVSKEDEATYLCQTGAAYNLAFVNGTNLIVNDSQNKKSYRVNQAPDMKSILLGTSVTLQCSLHPEKKKTENIDQCTDEHDVFWFRAESESNPGFIYADKKHCSKQAGRSCEYRLSKTIRNSSDTGTYYCAVVTCGEILFGEGTKVETSKILGQEVLLSDIVLGGLLACSVLVNFVLIFSRSNKKKFNEDKIGLLFVLICLQYTTSICILCASTC